MIQKCRPTIGMLVFFDQPAPETNSVLGSFCIKACRMGDGSEESSCGNYLPLAFGNLETVFLGIRNSKGVCAKNSARDITG